MENKGKKTNIKTNQTKTNGQKPAKMIHVYYTCLKSNTACAQFNNKLSFKKKI